MTTPAILPTGAEMAAEDAVEAALRFATTEPYGDLAISAPRAAFIAVHTLADLGWRPAEPATPEKRLTTGTALVLCLMASLTLVLAAIGAYEVGRWFR